MNALADAKAEVAATGKRFRTAAAQIVGSPVSMAVAAVFSLSFSSQLIYAPDRLPPIGGLSLAQVGLPSLDLGNAGTAIRDAAGAAQRQGAGDFIGGFFADHPQIIPFVNIAGLAFFLAFLAWTLYIQARHYRERPPL